jgi:ribonuclease P protein component
VLDAGVPTVTGQRFPKSVRLTRRPEFLAVQERGAKISADPLLALVLRNSLGCTRIGLTVSSKVGNAVVRARIRRHLRELFRKRQEKVPKGLDVVVIARNSAKDADFKRLERAFDTVCAKLRSMF